MIGKKANRNSHQRYVILEELRKVTSHPSAGALFEIVKKRIPNISLGTVYRNLELLSKKGIIQKLDISGSKARYDGDINKHYHICCTECGRIDDIYHISKKMINIDLSIIKGYDVKGYFMNFYGICPDCVDEQNNNKIK